MLCIKISCYQGYFVEWSYKGNTDGRGRVEECYFYHLLSDFPGKKKHQYPLFYGHYVLLFYCRFQFLFNNLKVILCSYDCSMLNAVNLVCSLGLSECNPLKCNESCLKEDSVVLILFRPTSVCSLSLSFSICSRSCVHWIYKYVLTKSGLNEWYIFQTICSYIS